MTHDPLKRQQLLSLHMARWKAYLYYQIKHEAMTMTHLSFVLLISVVVTSCGLLKKTAKQTLADGYYIQRVADTTRKVYVQVEDDSIRLFATLPTATETVIDESKKTFLYLAEAEGPLPADFSLRQGSFDVDFLTIPLRYRFAAASLPAQLNANLNGAVYLGYRTDVYQINYEKNPLRQILRRTTHLGYSIGLFTGIGNTFMSPTTTNNLLQQEYDGVVWSKGIAAIAGINNFTVGLTVGFDHLLDKNRNSWIYQGKPYLGLAFGLNLN